MNAYIYYSQFAYLLHRFCLLCRLQLSFRFHPAHSNDNHSYRRHHVYVAIYNTSIRLCACIIWNWEKRKIDRWNEFIHSRPLAIAVSVNKTGKSWERFFCVFYVFAAIFLHLTYFMCVCSSILFVCFSVHHIVFFFCLKCGIEVNDEIFLGI